MLSSQWEFILHSRDRDAICIHVMQPTKEWDGVRHDIWGQHTTYHPCCDFCDGLAALFRHVKYEEE